MQVGDAKKDHACWERPEDMDTPRSVFKIDANAPGSEVAAETAAALAAASLVFRRTDPTYSKILVRRAIRVSLIHDEFFFFFFCCINLRLCLFLGFRFFSLLINTEDLTAMS